MAILPVYLSPSLLNYTQMTYTFSIDKAKKELDYKPLMSVKDAIDILVHDYEKDLKTSS
jgi:nucleoside-diphosphate-sugar epimerase